MQVPRAAARRRSIWSVRTRLPPWPQPWYWPPASLARTPGSRSPLAHPVARAAEPSRRAPSGIPVVDVLTGRLAAGTTPADYHHLRFARSALCTSVLVSLSESVRSFYPFDVAQILGPASCALVAD